MTYANINKVDGTKMKQMLTSFYSYIILNFNVVTIFGSN